MNRRDFLKATLAATAGTFLANGGNPENLADRVTEDSDSKILKHRIKLLANYIGENYTSAETITNKEGDSYETGNIFKRSFEIGKRKYNVEYQIFKTPKLTITRERTTPEAGTPDIPGVTNIPACSFVDLSLDGYATKIETSNKANDVEYGRVVMDLLRAILIEDMVNYPDREFKGVAGIERNNEYSKSYKFDENDSAYVKFTQSSDSPTLRISGHLGEKYFYFSDLHCEGFLPKDVTNNQRWYRDLGLRESAWHPEISEDPGSNLYIDWKPAQVLQFNKKYDEVVTKLVGKIVKRAA